MELFQKVTIERNLIINSKYINKNLNENILRLLKNEIEEKCIPEGYIGKDSVEIIKRSIGTILTNSFKANVSYHILINANICMPYKNMIVKAKVNGINKGGIFCVSTPLYIIVPKNLIDSDRFESLNNGDEITVKIIGHKFNLYDNKIDVVASLYNDEENKNRAINKSNTIHNKSIKIAVSDNLEEDSESDISIFSDSENDEIKSLSSENNFDEDDDSKNILEEDTLEEEEQESKISQNINEQIIQEDSDNEEYDDDEDVDEDDNEGEVDEDDNEDADEDEVDEDDDEDVDEED